MEISFDKFNFKYFYCLTTKIDFINKIVSCILKCIVKLQKKFLSTFLWYIFYTNILLQSDLHINELTCYERIIAGREENTAIIY